MSSTVPPSSRDFTKARLNGLGIALGSIVLGAMSLLAAPWQEWSVVVTIGALCLAGIALTLGPNADPFSPWSMVFYSAAVGIGIRSVYVAEQGEAARSLFVLDSIGQEWVYPGLLLCLGLFLTGLAYRASSGQVRRKFVVPSAFSPRPQQVYLAVAIFSIIGLGGFLAYVDATTGFNFTLISGKRSTIETSLVGVETSFQSYEHLRFVHFAAVAAFVVLLAFWTEPGQRWTPARRFAVGLTALNALSFPFFASQRSGFLAVPLMGFAILHMRGRSISWIRLTAAGMAAVVTIGILTGFRSTRAESVESALTTITSPAALDALILNRNFLDLSKTVHVINSVGVQLEPANGTTYLSYLYAPIPRAIWPGKPSIAPGPIIGREIYGLRRSGVPPGYYAEAYWNFGLLGLLIGSPILGWALRRGELAFRAGGNESIPGVCLYVVVVLQFGELAVGAGLGPAVFGAASDVVMLLALLFVANSLSAPIGRPVVLARALGRREDFATS